MKNLVKLILSFSILFVFLFLIAVLLRYLGSWIEMAKTIPLGVEPGISAVDLAWKALPIPVYISVLLALSYSVRKKIPFPLAIFCIFILGCGFTAGFSLGISRAGALQFALRPVSPLQGRPGLILSRSDSAVILLKDSREILGPRVVSFPEQPLIYQEVPRGPNNTIISLPALSFTDTTPWFIRSLDIDFTLSSREMENRLKNGFIAFGSYAFSLVFLLASLYFLLGLSNWPLANLFFGAVVFRLILTLETFLNSREINDLIGSFLAGRCPPHFITPLVFCVLGVLIIIYTFLVRISTALKPWPKEDDDD